MENAKLLYLALSNMLLISIASFFFSLPVTGATASLHIPPLVATTLECRTYSGGDLDSGNPWSTSVTISSGKVYFRWTTTAVGVTSAEWQVRASSSMLASVIASGQLTQVPAAGQKSEFEIDTKSFLPDQPPATTKTYYVRVVPKQGSVKLTASPAAKIEHAKPGPAYPIEAFSLERLEERLKVGLDGKATGYAYAIYEFDTLKKAGAGGYAVLPGVLHSPDRRTTMLSMSKTVTAVAVMKAMEEMQAKGSKITIESFITDYLPSNWARGRNVEKIRFRHLLTHTSGLRPVMCGDAGSSDPDTFANLRASIAAGAIDPDYDRYAYVNANFALFRVIIPYMISDRSVLHAMEPNGGLMARHTGLTYTTYVVKHVLQPIGLGDIGVVPTGPQPYTRYYNFNSQTSYHFTDPTDDTPVLRGGAGYWHMSVKEFGRFMSAIRHHGRIISSDSFELMRKKNLGMYGNPGIYGTYFDHNGGYDNGRGAGTITAWMIFPNGVTVVITANSIGGLAEAPQNVIRNAFEAAW